MIKLGHTVKDEVTGFTGIVEAITCYLNGCCQVLVRPKFKPKDAEYPKAAWIDVEQIKVVKGTKILKLKQEKKSPSNGGGIRHHPSRE